MLLLNWTPHIPFETVIVLIHKNRSDVDLPRDLVYVIQLYIDPFQVFKMKLNLFVQL